MNDAPTAAPSSESASESKREETSELTGRDTGRNCAARSFTGTNRLKTIPRPRPVKVILSGSSLVSASVKMRPSRRKASVQYLSVARVIPKGHEQARNRAAVRTSISRYLGEMGALHLRQRPRKSSQLKTGTLS